MSAPKSPDDLAKKKKDPNRVKKPKSAFLLWCKDHRQKVNVFPDLLAWVPIEVQSKMGLVSL